MAAHALGQVEGADGVHVTQVDRGVTRALKQRGTPAERRVEVAGRRSR